MSRLNDEAFDASAATVSFDPLSDLVVVFAGMVDRGFIFRWLPAGVSPFNYGLCGCSIGYTGR